MRDLNLIIDDHAILNHCVIKGAPIHSRIGTDVHVVANAHTSKLADLLPAVGPRGKTKTVSTNHRMAVHSTVFAHNNAMVNHRLGMQPRACAEFGTVPHIGTCTNNNAIAQTGIGFHTGVCANADALTQGHAGVNLCGFMNARQRYRTVVEYLGSAGEADIRLRREQHIGGAFLLPLGL